MSAVEFEAWPKIARLNRGMVITEKIDGTNAAVVIVPLAEVDRWTAEDGVTTLGFFETDQRNIITTVDGNVVLAQSRTRFITPENDNYGFARWVRDNAKALVGILGTGRHFGEWWGSGIQRGYGLKNGDKRFSLFNTSRWDADRDNFSTVPGLGVVPVLAAENFSTGVVNSTLTLLGATGSAAAPGFTNPEGIVVYLSAARTSFKVTFKGDDVPKGAAGHALDIEAVAS